MISTRTIRVDKRTKSLNEMSYKEKVILPKGVFGDCKIAKPICKKYSSEACEMYLRKTWEIHNRNLSVVPLVRMSSRNRSYGRDLQTIFTLDTAVSDNRKRNILRQCTSGLKYLHRHKIVHKNINPTNVIVSAPNSKGVEIIKLMSFGKVDESYLASEVLVDGKYGSESDIFALGCVFHFVIHNGQHPYASENTKDNIINGNAVGLEIQADSFLMITQMLHHNSSSRSGLNKILQNYYFWPAKKCLLFFKTACDACKMLNSNNEPSSIVLDELNSFHSLSIGYNDWRKVVSSDIYRNTKTQKRCFKNNTSDLIRAVSQSVSSENAFKVNHTKEDIWKIWSSKFPCLLPFVYSVLRNVSHNKLQRFYAKGTELPSFHKSVLGC